MKYKVGELLEILWLDAVGENDGWDTTEGFDYEYHSKGALVMTCGYFQKLGKKSIYLSQNYRGIDHALSRMISIPIGCIVKTMRRGSNGTKRSK